MNYHCCVHELPLLYTFDADDVIRLLQVHLRCLPAGESIYTTAYKVLNIEREYSYYG